MIGRFDHDGVNVLLFLEQLAIVLILLRIRKPAEHPGGVGPVHVAERDDVFAGQLADVLSALAADANARNVQFLVGRFRPTTSKDMAGNNHEGGGSPCRTRDKLAPRQPRSADILVCGFTGLSCPVNRATGKLPEAAGWKACAA